MTKTKTDEKIKELEKENKFLLDRNSKFIVDNRGLSNLINILEKDKQELQQTIKAKDNEIKNKWKEVHINKDNFKMEGMKFWVVGYNEGGIGTPLFDVDEDVKWFINKQIQSLKKENEELRRK